MVVLGYEDTTLVRLEEIEHHLRAVRRGTKNALVVGDLPYQTYQTPEQAVATALRLAAAGAEAVKLEGGTRQADKVRAIVEAGIPAMGHLGMLPQRVREEGGYKKKGKTRGDAEQLLQGARDLERAGVFAIVLESMVAEVAEAITREVSVPTIGIGAGQATDGQVLVVHDLIGGFPWFRPKFAMVAADIATEIRRAADEYRRAVIEG
ncbi:MAG: 3-methyl-2-oxobutanoate hydroxymethyltransferase [Verrucomicrobiales bacterium]